MRYPVLSTADAAVYLAAKRKGEAVDLQSFVRIRGEGQEIDQGFVNALNSDLQLLKSTLPSGIKSPKDANDIESRAARLVHQHVQLAPEIAADADFWLWLAVGHFVEFVEWRYGCPAGGTKLANYGIGVRTENLLYRLWLRADLVLDDEASDRYHLSERGQIDFYRSHLFRQGYANARNFARAFLKYQYRSADKAAPYLGIGQVRELVKRLRRLRANLFLEVLEEEECRQVIEAEAKVVLAIK